jgi:hypothetical protein
MVTVYTQTEGGLYETVCARKPTDRAKIQIHEIHYFQGANVATTVKWEELDPDVRKRISQDISNRFAQES